MNIQLAKTVLIVMTLVLYVITESVLILALAGVAAIILMIPDQLLKRVLGYTALADFTMSMYVIGVASTSATFASLATGVFTALGLSIALRSLKMVYGSERLEINGRSDPGGLIAESSTWLVRYIRSLFTGLVKGTKVEVEELHVAWIEYTEGRGWKSSLLFAIGM